MSADLRVGGQHRPPLRENLKPPSQVHMKRIFLGRLGTWLYRAEQMHIVWDLLALLYAI
jgi:hypothetical protein